MYVHTAAEKNFVMSYLGPDNKKNAFKCELGYFLYLSANLQMNL